MSQYSQKYILCIQNENPGPGMYVGHVTYKSNKTSYSKKGYGGFVSKDRRVARLVVPSGPGAGKYTLPSAIQSRNDFNRKNTANFHQPIAQHVDKLDSIPGPDSYNVRLLLIFPYFIFLICQQSGPQ